MAKGLRYTLDRPTRTYIMVDGNFDEVQGFTTKVGGGFYFRPSPEVCLPLPELEAQTMKALKEAIELAIFWARENFKLLCEENRKKRARGEEVESICPPEFRDEPNHYYAMMTGWTPYQA